MGHIAGYENAIGLFANEGCRESSGVLIMPSRQPDVKIGNMCEFVQLHKKMLQAGTPCSKCTPVNIE